MKGHFLRIHRTRVSVCLVLVSAVLACGASAQTLLNGSFEGASSGGVAVGWTSYVEPGGTINPTIQTANPADGVQYQQVQVTAANKYAGVYQVVSGCTIGEVYTVSGYYRTNSLSATSSVRVDPSGGIARPATVMASTTSTSFTQFSGNVTAAANSITIFLDVAVTTSNKAGAFDGITVTATGCSAPAPPTAAAASPPSIAAGQSSTLTASVEPGCTIDWYAGSCGGTLAGSGVSLVVSPNATTAYYPRARNLTTGCVSPGCGSPVVVSVTSSNLLLNGGFETWSGSQCADNWTQYNIGPVTCSKGSTYSGTPPVVPYSGQECQRVTLDYDYEQGGVYQRFNSVAGSHYTVSVWMLTREESADAEARLGVDPTGATTPGVNTAWSSRVTGDSGWTLKTLTVTAVGPLVTVFLHGIHPGKGTAQSNVFFDEAAAYASASPPSAKNVIIAIGDGMGYEHVQAGSFYLAGSSGKLCFEPYHKCAVTTSCLQGVTDSAAAATAIATGHKTNKMVIGQSPSGEVYQSVLEYAETLGKSSGLVTNDVITGATPAGFGAHQGSRYEYLSIGNDYLYGSCPEVIFGGGDPAAGDGTYFSSSQVSAAQSLGYVAVYNNTQMAALDPAAVSKSLGLFKGSRLTFEGDRIPSNPEPHLSQMAAKALAILERDPDGFFLLIEGDNIDETSHDNSIVYTTKEVVEFNNTVNTILNWMSGRNDTLLIVTADHETGGLDVGWGAQGSYPSATWSSTGHTAANVPLYAVGAGSSLVNQFVSAGVMDNTQIFAVMYQALQNSPVPQPPPAVTSITPACLPNTGVFDVSDVSGSGFVSGASVKLKRAGCADIDASSVTVVSPARITCSFDLAGKQVGLWDVVVTNPDGRSGTLARGFGIGLASDLPVFGVSSAALSHQAARTASSSTRFRVWGRVQTIDASGFRLDDGSGSGIRVFAPGCSGISDGTYVSVTGTADTAVTPVTLVSRADWVTIHN